MQATPTHSMGMIMRGKPRTSKSENVASYSVYILLAK